MAQTKSELITAINGYITAVITQLKHRNSMLELINTFFSTIKHEYNDGVTNTILDTNYATLEYHIRMKKEGNKVFMSGYIKKTGETSLGGLNDPIIDIIDSHYNGKTGYVQRISARSNNGDVIMLNVNQSTFYLYQSTIAVGQEYWLDTFYLTND